MEEKIWILGAGLFHENYAFVTGDKTLVLRLARVERGLQNRREAGARIRGEAKTLQALQSLELPFAVPELICPVRDESGETIGLIESEVAGMPLKMLERHLDAESQLKMIAHVASSVHELPQSKFTHLRTSSDSPTHVLEALQGLPGSLFEQFGEAALGREWILANLPQGRASTVLHGDLLPQNLLFSIGDHQEIGVVDWECARIGDAAYDLAIVTRGMRRPFGMANGLQRLVMFYNEAAEEQIPTSAVMVHEVLLHLHWLAESQTENRPGGHGPEHYAELLGAILRRARALESIKS